MQHCSTYLGLYAMHWVRSIIRFKLPSYGPQSIVTSIVLRYVRSRAKVLVFERQDTLFCPIVLLRAWWL